MPTLYREIIQCENNPLWNQNCCAVSEFKRWLGLCSSVQLCICLLTGSKLMLLKDGETWNSKFWGISAKSSCSRERVRDKHSPHFGEGEEDKAAASLFDETFHPTPHRTRDNTTPDTRLVTSLGSRSPRGKKQPENNHLCPGQHC